MNPEWKARWVTALRSGEYQQTASSLHDSTGFCCLGVLCDLYAKEENVPWVRKYVHSYSGIETMHGNAENLPEQVMEKVGLRSPDPIIEQSSLSELNDGGASFEEISFLIERYL